MSFKFTLEPLMKHRKRLEEDAQREFFKARSAVDEALRKINSLYESIDHARRQIQLLQKSGGQSIAAITQHEEFIVGAQIRIERERKVARELMMVAEEKHQLLLEAAKEFKSIEKLKERRHRQYLEDKKKQELKIIDQTVTMRFKRGAVG
jgi:flagellar FliJ protein